MRNDDYFVYVTIHYVETEFMETFLAIENDAEKDGWEEEFTEFLAKL